MNGDLAKAFGGMIRERRRKACLTQSELALLSGTGIRFIIDLEAGKASCQLGKALKVGQTLGISVCAEPDNNADSSMPDFAS